jgi:AcrR family transcriptional regulator
MASRVVEVPRAAETEAAIVEAARDLLAEGGLDTLSMRAVAGRVGVSATAIYHYFENKQALVDRVVLSGFRRFVDYLVAAADRVPADSPDRLHALGLAYLRFALENRQYFKVMFTIQPEDPRALEELPGGGGYELLLESVELAMEAGDIRRDDPHLVAFYLWSHVHGLATLCLACDFEPVSGCESDPLEAFSRFREFIREGLRPRDASSEAGSSQAESLPASGS